MNLFGNEPVASDDGSDMEMRCAQYVIRWVQLPHQRASALTELRALIAAHDAECMAEMCRNAGCQEIR